MNDTHRMRARLRMIIVMMTVFVAGLLASRLIFEPEVVAGNSAIATRVATVLAPPRPLPDFELVNQSAQPLGKEDLKGHWTLVFLGFTNCGDICPTTLVSLSEAVRPLAEPPDVLFVSVDPERDSPAVINAYVHSFSGSFFGATGSDEQLRNFAGGLSAAFSVSRNPDRYQVNHSSAVFLLDPAAQLYAVFSAPHDPEAIAEDLARILNRRKATAPLVGQSR